MITTLAQLAAGERMSLVLFAVMSLMALARARVAPANLETAALHRRLSVRGWLFFALSAVTYPPVHAAQLLGIPAPILLTRIADLVASGFACASLVSLLALLGLELGLPAWRVRRGVALNAGVTVAMMGVTWAMH